MKEDLLILSGDKRQEYLWEYLKAREMNCVYLPCKNLPLSALLHFLPNFWRVVFPMPFSTFPYSWEELIETLTPSQIIIGGNLPAAFTQALDKKEIPYWDYFSEEETAILNSIATAEGALGTAISTSPDTICGSKCLVSGFGRCGKTLGHLLKQCGALVTVATNEPSEIAFGRTLGLTTQTLSDAFEDLSSYEMIFNTIPACLFTEPVLATVSGKCYFFDLASPPFGIEDTLADIYDFHYMRLPGLPGKTAPKAAGEIIGSSILSHFTT